MDIFETATRKRFRFPSIIGDLTTEQLWDLPLTARSHASPDLDHVARAVNADLKAVTEETFVSDKPDPKKPDLEMKLEIVKHIIAEKRADALAAKTRADNAALKSKILEAIAAKDNDALANMSKDELLKRLEALEVA